MDLIREEIIAVKKSKKKLFPTRKDNLAMDGSSNCNSFFTWHVSVTAPISYNSSFSLFEIMEKSVLTTPFATDVVDITIFRPLSTIDTPLSYGCSPLGSFQVGYSDVWSARSEFL